MAVSVDDIYKFCLRLMRKNQSGNLKSTDFEIFWNDAQNSYMEFLLGNPNEKTRMTGLILNEAIINKLAPFTQIASAQPITSGVGAKPVDFSFKLAIRINGFSVFHLNHDQFAFVTNDPLDPPSVADNTYYYTEYLGNYNFLPNTVTTFDLDYITVPVNVKWGFTVVNGRQVYDPSTSVQPQWRNADSLLITKRMFTNIGVPYQSRDFENFGMASKATAE